MSGFSQRSWVSKSSTQLWYLWVPDCMAFLAGWYTRTRRVTICQRGQKSHVMVGYRYSGAAGTSRDWERG